MLAVSILVTGLVTQCVYGVVLLTAIVSFVVTKGAGLGAALAPGRDGRLCEKAEMIIATPAVHYDEC